MPGARRLSSFTIRKFPHFNGGFFNLLNNNGLIKLIKNFNKTKCKISKELKSNSLIIF